MFAVSSSGSAVEVEAFDARGGRSSPSLPLNKAKKKNTPPPWQSRSASSRRAGNLLAEQYTPSSGYQALCGIRVAHSLPWWWIRSVEGVSYRTVVATAVKRDDRRSARHTPLLRADMMSISVGGGEFRHGQSFFVSQFTYVAQWSSASSSSSSSISKPKAISTSLFFHFRRKVRLGIANRYDAQTVT